MNIKFQFFYLGLCLFGTISFSKPNHLSYWTNYRFSEFARDSINEKQFQLPDSTVSIGPFMKLNTEKHSFTIEHLKLSEQQFPHINSIKTLSARVPGVQVNETNGDMASSVLAKIRGSHPYFGKGMPLYVIDGVRFNNSGNGINIMVNSTPVDYGDNTLDFNIEDIKDITVLKGGIASMIYGSQAANGAILINTKRATKNGLNLKYSSSLILDKVYKRPDFQYEYGQGGNGIFNMRGSYAFGPRLDDLNMAIQFDSPVDQSGDPIPTLLRSYPDNQIDFFQTAKSFNNTLSISSKGKYLEGGLSFGDVRYNGVIPETDLRRNTINSYGLIRPIKKLVISANLAYSKIDSNNRPASGRRSPNPVSAVYHIPPNVSIKSLKNYWVEGQENLHQRNYDFGTDNPWFTLGENRNKLDRNRFWGGVRAQYSILAGLDVFGSYTMDMYSEKIENKKAFSSYKFPYGQYGIKEFKHDNSNVNFGVSFTKKINKFDIFSTICGDLMVYNDSTWAKFRSVLDIPLEYIFNDESNFSYNSVKYEQQRYYWLNEIGFDNIIFVDLAIGNESNDGNHFLKQDDGNFSNLSFGTNIVLSNIFKLPSWMDRFTYKANWSRNNGYLNYVFYPGLLINNDLTAPSEHIFETGFVLRFLQNKLNLGFNYYNIFYKNLLLALRLNNSTGFSSTYINGLDISEKGIEINLSTTLVQHDRLRWDFGVTFYKNRLIAEHIVDDMYINDWDKSRITNRIIEGEKIGNLYARSLVKVEDETSPYYGYLLLNDEGYPMSNHTDNRLLGNVNHDFSMGFNSGFQYKNISLNVLFDWRQGGVFASNTMRYLASDGLLKSTLEGSAKKDMFDNGRLVWVGGRDEAHGGLPWPGGNPWNPDNIHNASFIPGVYEDDEGNYVLNDGNPETTFFITDQDASGEINWDYPDNWLYPASFVKLRELSISYTLPSKVTENIFIEKARFSLVGSNFLLWSEAGKAGLDPEHNHFIYNGNFKQGMENYSIPPVTSWGFKLNLEI